MIFATLPAPWVAYSLSLSLLGKVFVNLSHPSPSLCICLCLTFYTHTHTNPHKAAVIFTSGSTDSCKDLTQKMQYLRKHGGGKVRETLRIRGRLSLSPRGPPSEIQEAAGHESTGLRSCKASPPTTATPISTGDQLNLQPCSPKPHPLLSSAGKTLTGQRSLYPPHPPSMLAPTAPGQSTPHSHWDTSSHGNL